MKDHVKKKLKVTSPEQIRVNGEQPTKLTKKVRVSNTVVTQYKIDKKKEESLNKSREE